MITHIDPKVDYAFKRVFGTEQNVPILIDILQAILDPPPGQRILSLELLNPFHEKETANDKLSVVDIKVRDQDGRLYNVEMQIFAAAMFPQRVLYYWANLYGSQLAKGESYEKLHKTVSISIVNNVLLPTVPKHHSVFQLRELTDPSTLFCELQEMHVIELRKFTKTLEQLATPLDVWCYFLKNAADLDTDNLPDALSGPAMKLAIEVLKMISQTDLERERYLERERAERDELSLREYHRTIEEKFQRSQEEARRFQDEARTARIDQIHFCQRLLNLPLSAKEELFSHTPDELHAIAKALEQQVESRGA